ncbi:hypothetical protein [Ferrimicrobium sp.]|uniref:hypothetical protein n=1 Tax=Ferrimicrobium sp. TaxID=2926050 RepID=UPI002626F64C|nr:hypothetical protein [Ferrimicrobium sp.]
MRELAILRREVALTGRVRVALWLALANVKKTAIETALMAVRSNPIGEAATTNASPMSSEPPREASVLCLRRYGGVVDVAGRIGRSEFLR